MEQLDTKLAELAGETENTGKLQEICAKLKKKRHYNPNSLLNGSRKQKTYGTNGRRAEAHMR
ncbi:MAG: hypothetical protein ACLSG8_00310 [Barnesiella sp.]